MDTDWGAGEDRATGRPAHAEMKMDADALARWCTTPMEAGTREAHGLAPMRRGQEEGHETAHILQMACMMALMMQGAGMAGGDPADFERTYIRMMILHHESVLAMARLAQERASHPELAAFAANVTRVQQAETATLSGWLRAWHDEAAPSLSGTPLGAAMEAADHKLAGLHGDAFDRALLDAMIHHHLMAVHMSDHAIDFATHPEVRALAGEVVHGQEAEIHQLRLWRAEWFGGPAPPPA